MEFYTQQIIFLVLLIIFQPIAILASYLFYERRDIQPIKSRYPKLVLVQNCFLQLFFLFLCLQRLFAESIPCWLTLWAGYLGTILICNTYLIRCWILYFTFRSTIKMAERDLHEPQLNWFVRNKYLRDVYLLSFVGILMSLLLLLPAMVATATVESVTSYFGDGCNREYADLALAGISVVYVIVFSSFGYLLKNVDDNFHIVEELKGVGISCICAVVPWFLFNNIRDLKFINNSVFAVSTLCILSAITAAFCSSVIMPLYYSYIVNQGMESGFITPDEVNTLPKLLAYKIGIASFSSYLEKEFALENLYFYFEVNKLVDSGNRYLKLPSADAIDKIYGKAVAIYDKYVSETSPYQVNLPSELLKVIESVLKIDPKLTSVSDSFIVKQLRAISLRANRTDSDSTKPISPISSPNFLLPNLASPVTLRLDSSDIEKEIHTLMHIYDEAQKEIMRLMTRDSYNRYLGSKEYANLLAQLQLNANDKETLIELNVI